MKFQLLAAHLRKPEEFNGSLALMENVKWMAKLLRERGAIRGTVQKFCGKGNVES